MFEFILVPIISRWNCISVPKDCFVLSNTADPDEMPHSTASHQGHHCLLLSILYSIHSTNTVRRKVDIKMHVTNNSLPAQCCLLITFAHSLPDQARQKVVPDLDLNCLTLWWYSCKIFSIKVDSEKTQQTTIKLKLPSRQSVNGFTVQKRLSQINHPSVAYFPLAKFSPLPYSHPRNIQKLKVFIWYSKISMFKLKHCLLVQVVCFRV